MKRPYPSIRPTARPTCTARTFRRSTTWRSAEEDYRRGLELSPNSAEGYAGLAEVLDTSWPRRDEALELLDRARRLDPLKPAYDVRKAVYLYDERSDPVAARELLRDVVALHPRYAPAAARLCESNLLVGDIAEGVRYCEEALALDPLLEESRRFLIHQYLLLGEPDVAEVLVERPGEEPNLRALPILIDRRDWVGAGEVAYRALERRTTSPTARWYACSAIRMHARTTGDYRRAIEALEAEAGIAWGSSGDPGLPDEPTRVRDPAIALADVLLQSGQEQRGHRLLAAILARMRHEVGELGRPEYWYVHFHPAALVMHGEHDAAIAMLERSITQSAKPVIAWWQLSEIEPAFAVLRGDPRFEGFEPRCRPTLPLSAWSSIACSARGCYRITVAAPAGSFPYLVPLLSGILELGPPVGAAPAGRQVEDGPQRVGIGGAARILAGIGGLAAHLAAQKWRTTRALPHPDVERGHSLPSGASPR